MRKETLITTKNENSILLCCCLSFNMCFAHYEVKIRNLIHEAQSRNSLVKCIKKIPLHSNLTINIDKKKLSFILLLSTFGKEREGEREREKSRGKRRKRERWKDRERDWHKRGKKRGERESYKKVKTKSGEKD